jgi:hypothetical protein
MAETIVVEGSQEEEAIQPDAEGKIAPDKEGKYPQVVPYHKYVGIKEKFTRVEKELNAKVSSLEEQVKKANPAELAKVTEELGKIKADLEAKTAEFTKVQGELDGMKNKSIADKKANLIKLGVKEETLKDMGDKEMDKVLEALASAKGKPKSDLGSGGGTGVPVGSPMDLARQAYSQTK